MKIFWGTFVTFCLYGSAFSQITSPDKCPNITKSVSNLDVNQLSNRTWYEVGRYPTLFEISGTCNIVVFQPGANGSVDLVNEYNSGITGKEVPIFVTLIPDSDDSSLFHTEFPLSPNLAMSKCWFLDVDYNSYASAFCCTDLDDGTSMRYIYCLGSEPQPDESVMDKAFDAYKENNIDTQAILKTDQKDCVSNSSAQ